RIEQVISIITPVLAVIGTLWAAIKYVLQPAYKITQSEERAKQYKLTAEAYKTRIDEMIEHIDKLTVQVKEQTQRSDMLILYIADRLVWERSGRIGKSPILPPEIEASIYDMRIRQGDDTTIHPA